MQFFPLFCHGQSSGQGSSYREPAIEASGLYALIVETFANLGTPPGLHGAAKLAQRQNNPDAFDLYFFSSTSFNPYDVGGTYSAPDLAVFARSDFEHFLELENGCRQRLQEFTRRLLAGELRAGRYE